MLELGKKARDKITGFTGIITARGQHLYGCDTYGLTPSVDKDGKLLDSLWFDEGRIEIIDDGIDPASVRVEKNGAGENPKSTANNPH